MEYIRTKEKIAQTKSRVKDVSIIKVTLHSYWKNNSPVMKNSRPISRMANIKNH